ncbi:MAG TPA: hypothetical protein VD908_01515 [Cytophagales bacterium]|nr:hypothetical protein [Cytophagales bacterium]
MFYIEVNKRFLSDDEELANQISNLSKGSDEKDYSVVFLTNHEEEIVNLLRQKEIAFTMTDREAAPTGAPDTF